MELVSPQIHVRVITDTLDNNAKLITVMVCCSTLLWCALQMVLVPLRIFVLVSLAISVKTVNCGLVTERFTMIHLFALIMVHVWHPIHVHATMDT